MNLSPRDLDGSSTSAEAYYDPSLNITWKANIFDSWEDYGFPGWRLPTFDISNPTFSYDGSTSLGYNITTPSNELAHLFYVTLGNQGLCDVTGICGVDDDTNANLNIGPFIFPVKTFPIETDHQNWQLNFSTDVLYDPSNFESGHYYFSFEAGCTGVNYGDGGVTIAWMVHDGDVVASVPVPPSSLLLLIGLLMFFSLLRISTGENRNDA